MQKQLRPVFMKARWENLLMINYEIDPELLKPYLPKFTELDLFEGKNLVSLVGFMFRDTRVFGLKWPWHTHFEEVNLRFYVKHFDGVSWKRGVVFISEIVPSPVISTTARLLYHEPYTATAMRHDTQIAGEHLNLQYEWRGRSGWNKLSAIANVSLNPIQNDTEQEFIFEHYWGYNKYDENTTIEYGVEHDVWQVHQVTSHVVEVNIAEVYGSQFVEVFRSAPSSILLAKGSDVIIRKPTFLR